MSDATWITAEEAAANARANFAQLPTIDEFAEALRAFARIGLETLFCAPDDEPEADATPDA